MGCTPCGRCALYTMSGSQSRLGYACETGSSSRLTCPRVGRTVQPVSAGHVCCTPRSWVGCTRVRPRTLCRGLCRTVTSDAGWHKGCHPGMLGGCNGWPRGMPSHILRPVWGGCLLVFGSPPPAQAMSWGWNSQLCRPPPAQASSRGGLVGGPSKASVRLGSTCDVAQAGTGPRLRDPPLPRGGIV